MQESSFGEACLDPKTDKVKELNGKSKKKVNLGSLVSTTIMRNQSFSKEDNQNKT